MPYLNEEEFNYNFDGSFVKISVYDRYGVFKLAETIIDVEDLDKVRCHKWHIVCSTEKVYVRTYDRVQNKHINMSHVILDLPQSRKSQVDHIDGNTLDNRKLNLRPCTSAQNSRNYPSPKGTSKYKGVSWSKDVKKWRADIAVDYREIYLGLFINEANAARAYNEAAEKHFGEFAYLNEVERR